MILKLTVLNELGLPRKFSAQIGDARHNNRRMMDENKEKVSSFNDESFLCNNIAWNKRSEMKI